MYNRGLLLDRDGIINVDTSYVSQKEHFVFVDGLFPFLRSAQDYGYRLAIVTNQSGVARGLYSDIDFERLTVWMLAELRREKIEIDIVLACFEHKDGSVPEYRRESFWRKPNPGMILDAVQRMRLNPHRSAFLGDNLTDMQAGKAGGIGTCLFLGEKPAAASSDFTYVENFSDALAHIEPQY